MVFWHTTCWMLWNARNNTILNSVESKPGGILVAIKSVTWQWIAYKKGSVAGYQFSSWCLNPLVCLRWLFEILLFLNYTFGRHFFFGFLGLKLGYMKQDIICIVPQYSSFSFVLMYILLINIIIPYLPSSKKKVDNNILFRQGLVNYLSHFQLNFLRILLYTCFILLQLLSYIILQRSRKKN